MHFSYLIAAAAGVLLAGSTQAINPVNFTVGTTTLPASGLVNFTRNQGFVDTTLGCSTQCTNISTIFNKCGNTDNACICTNDNGQALFACESCLYNATIRLNVPVPDPLLGSQPALTAFTAGCAAVNITLSPLKLALAPGWNGPESNKLALPVNVVAVAAGAILGGASLYIMATIE